MDRLLSGIQSSLSPESEPDISLKSFFPSLGKLLFQSTGDEPEASDPPETKAERKVVPLPRGSPPLALNLVTLGGPQTPGVTPRGVREPPSSKEFRRICSEVIPDQLYVAGWLISENWADLESRQITHIINTAGTVSRARFMDRITYLNLPIEDSKTEDIHSYFYACIDFIESAVISGGRVLIHCMEGVSRSCTIAMAYVMWKRRFSYTEAQAFVQAARPICQPNAGFICQLLSFHKRLLKQYDPESLFRITVRTCSGSSLVVATTVPATGPLDPRFAYIIQKQNRFTIWVDRHSHLFRHLQKLSADVLEQICRIEGISLALEYSESPPFPIQVDHGLDREIETIEAFLHPENVPRQSHRSDRSSSENPFTSRSHRSVVSEEIVKVFLMDQKTTDLNSPIPYFDSDDLDSRCTYLFVIVGSKTAVVWVGNEVADNSMEDMVDVRDLVGSDYEVHLVQQGEETNDFWDLFQQG